MKLKDIVAELEKIEKKIEKYRAYPLTIGIDGKKIRFRLAGSSHGQWVHTFIDDEEDGERMVIDDMKKFGSGFYYHNDFNYYYRYITRKQAIWLCKNAERILEKIREKIREIEEENKKYFD